MSTSIFFFFFEKMHLCIDPIIFGEVVKSRERKKREKEKETMPSFVDISYFLA